MSNTQNRSLTGKLAIFLATSGHSGVDTVMGNLIHELVRRGLPVDLLKIRGHGPNIIETAPCLTKIEFPVAHVNSALPSLINYLKNQTPKVLLTDKDRVNRIALVSRRLAGVGTRLAIRVGTTVTPNIARRGWLHRKMQFMSIRHLYPWADCIIVPSKGAAEDLNAIGQFDTNLIRVIPSPIVSSRIEDLSKATPDHPWVADGSKPLIVAAGELCSRKDFATLIVAFSILRKQRVCRLIILGEGRKRDSLRQLAKSLGVEEDVSMPGFVSNPYGFMKRASVFVLSSNCEGAPVVLIEALALGVPVVSTDCPSGPREILQDGKIGPLVSVGDPEAMACAISSVLDNPPDPHVLKVAARPYSVQQATDRYLEALGLF